VDDLFKRDTLCVASGNVWNIDHLWIAGNLVHDCAGSCQ
jgi:hypothetical protein